MNSFSLLLEKTHTIYDLGRVAEVLEWDKEVNMPPGGIEGRSQQLTTVRKMRHELFVSDEMGDLIGKSEEEVKDFSPNSFESSLVRCLKAAYLKTKKLSTDYVVRENNLSANAKFAWVMARKESNFNKFLPYLKEIILLYQEKSELYGYDDHPYDALIDNFDTDAKTKEVIQLFDTLKKELTRLLEKIKGSKKIIEDNFLFQNYPLQQQKDFAVYASKAIGFDYQRGHLGTVVHPFCTNFGKNDVRITTRWNENYLNVGLFMVLHESGHALYEQGMDDSLKRTELCSATSLGIHESQSRMFENMVCKSLGFWQKHFGKLKETFPKSLKDVDVKTFYNGLNKIKSNFIRVESDELTYNIHIMLRFELELEMLSGKLEAKDVPEAWNQKMLNYLGLKVDKDSNGCLQDDHWTNPGFGYFPTYTMGNLYAAQFLETATLQNKNISVDLANGETNSLLQWLRTNIHSHGKKFSPKELITNVTGKALSHEPFMRYVQNKYGQIYDI